MCFVDAPGYFALILMSLCATDDFEIGRKSGGGAVLDGLGFRNGWGTLGFYFSDL